MLPCFVDNLGKQKNNFQKDSKMKMDPAAALTTVHNVVKRELSSRAPRLWRPTHCADQSSLFGLLEKLAGAP